MVLAKAFFLRTLGIGAMALGRVQTCLVGQAFEKNHRALQGPGLGF